MLHPTYRCDSDEGGYSFVPQQGSQVRRSKGSRHPTPYDLSRKAPGSITWSHKFVCLADVTDVDVPSSQAKYILKCAGLGEKM